MCCRPLFFVGASKVTRRHDHIKATFPTAKNNKTQLSQRKLELCVTRLSVYMNAVAICNERSMWIWFIGELYESEYLAEIVLYFRMRSFFPQGQCIWAVCFTFFRCWCQTNRQFREKEHICVTDPCTKNNKSQLSPHKA